VCPKMQVEKIRGEIAGIDSSHTSAQVTSVGCSFASAFALASTPGSDQCINTRHMVLRYALRIISPTASVITYVLSYYMVVVITHTFLAVHVLHDRFNITMARFPVAQRQQHGMMVPHFLGAYGCRTYKRDQGLTWLTTRWTSSRNRDLCAAVHNSSCPGAVSE
jgi:hypothetical protein